MRPSGKGGLPGLAVRRPVTIGMLFLSLVVIGIVAWRNIPIKLLPEGLSPPFLWIWMSYPNASPIENQENIAAPIEEAFWTIKGVKSIYSRSRENGCGIFVEFNQSVDMDVAYLAVRDRIERTRPELPDDQRYVYIRRYSESDEPILYFGISITGNYDDPYRLVKEEVVSSLERIDGVAAVEMWGGGAKEVLIQFSLDRLRAQSIDVASLMSSLRSANFAVAGGIIRDENHQLLIRADGRITDLEQLRKLPVKGAQVHLEDVAEVVYDHPEARWIQRIGRRPAIQMGIFKESDANTVETALRLRSALDEMSKNPALKGMHFDVLFDQGELITQSLMNLEEAGLWGAIFAVIVLFLFLRRVRMTLFITFAIPVSILVTITYMYFIGWSLNLVTLSGLIICVGLVVDNAIVVVENIQVMKQRGLSSQEAAIFGASDVGLAITLATLTTVVVFLPLILMGENRIITFYLLRIGMPVIVALLVSLMVAILFIPLAVHKFALTGAAKKVGIVETCAMKIERLVYWVLNHRASSIVILLMLLFSTSIPMGQVISTDEEEGHINDFHLRFHFPPHYGLTGIDTTLTRLENYLYENKERFDIKTIVTGFQRGHGRMRVFLNENEDHVWFVEGLRSIAFKIGLMKSNHLSRKEAIEEIKEKYTIPPGVEMFTSWNQGRGDESTTYVTVYGEDTKKLLGITEDVKRLIENLPKVITVEMDLEESNDEVNIIFDRFLTSTYNVNAAQASYGLHSLVRGVELPTIRIGDHEIDARAELAEEDRTTLPQVMNLPVSSESREVVRIDDIADVTYNRGIGEISRENRRTRIRLKVISTEKDIHKLSRNIERVLGGLTLPTGYEWKKGDRFRSVEDASRERSQAWLLAITFVFLLMGALFESFSLPWAVIVTIPFSFFGVWWMLFLTGTQFGLMAGIGVVILIGVVVNNAIVLVDRANRLRKSGVSRDIALAEASRQRFRPIAMTALTTIMGLMPMAVGNANLIGIPYAPMGRAIIGGMLCASILTPVVVPLAYSLIDDMKSWFFTYFKSVRSI